MSLRFERLSTNFQTGSLKLPSDDVLMPSPETHLPADRARLLVRGGAPQAASMAAGGGLDDGSEELGAVQVQSSGTAFWPWSMWARSEPAPPLQNPFLLPRLQNVDDDCFYYHSWRNNVVIAFGTLSSCVYPLLLCDHWGLTCKTQDY